MKHSIYIKVAALLVSIAIVAVALTALFSSENIMQNDLCVVTAFYPVYIAALNVTDGVENIDVVNMVDNSVGCLHDYQMDPLDRVALEKADVLVMNGAGAEPFLTDALETVEVTVVDLSEGQQLLESGHVHGHDHDHDEQDHTEEIAVNDHLWVSAPRYMQQIQTLCDGLCAADPKNELRYRRNTAAYLVQIEAVWERLQQAAKPLVGVPSVLFHDSLAYLAEDLDLTVVSALNVGEDSGVSAAELAHTEDALRDAQTAVFWYDSQYATTAYTYLQEIPERATVLQVDTAVTGEDSADAWLAAMAALCEQLEAAG